MSQQDDSEREYRYPADEIEEMQEQQSHPVKVWALFVLNWVAILTAVFLPYVAFLTFGFESAVVAGLTVVNVLVMRIMIRVVSGM